MTLTIRMGRQVDKTRYSGRDVFGRAAKHMVSKVVDMYVRGTMDTIEQQLGQILFLIGDYWAELIKSNMAVYGPGTPGFVHVVTGSLMESIKNKSGRGIGGVRSKRSVRGRVIVGIDTSETRYERSAALGGSDIGVRELQENTGVQLYNTGEPVQSYGVKKLSELAPDSNMPQTIAEGVLANLAAQAAYIRNWMNTPYAAHIRTLTEQLRAANFKKIETSAQNRIKEAQANRDTSLDSDGSTEMADIPF